MGVADNTISFREAETCILVNQFAIAREIGNGGH